MDRAEAHMQRADGHMDRIEKQNEEIISLLKSIAGQTGGTPDEQGGEA